MSEKDVSDLVSTVEQLVEEVEGDVDEMRVKKGRFRAVIDYRDDEFRLFDDEVEDLHLRGGLHAFRSD